MFERAIIVSAVLVFTSFCLSSSTLFRFIGLKAESPITVIREILPSIDTTETTDTTATIDAPPNSLP